MRGRKPVGVEKDYALIFATNVYDEWEDLANPVLDAKTIAKELENEYGFETVLVENPGLDEIYTKLKAYGELTYKPDDQLFIMITGPRFLRRRIQ